MITYLILANRIETSLLNTVLGMVTVFAVLIIIIFFISLLGIIPKLKSRKEKKDNVTTQYDEYHIENDAIYNPIKPKGYPIQPDSTAEDLLKNQELVAAITAAIMVYMEDDVPSDGLIIRSIKRANVSNWKKSWN